MAALVVAGMVSPFRVNGRSSAISSLPVADYFPDLLTVAEKHIYNGAHSEHTYMYVFFSTSRHSRVSMSSIEKRDQIIAAGVRVFPKLGYHGTTVEDVIREAGVARATFYAYFADKRGLFIEIATGRTAEIVQILTLGVDSVIEQYEAQGAEALDQETFQAPLSDLVEAIFRFVRSNRGVTKIFLHEMVGADKEFTRIFNDYQEALIKQMERLIDYGVRLGVMKQTDCRKAAEFIISGHMHLARSFSASGGRYDVEAIARQFIDYQFNGLLEKNDSPSADGKKKSTAARTGARD